MFNYRVSFRGREVGAIGVFSDYSFYIQAASRRKAGNKLYETHEHITRLSMKIQKQAVEVIFSDSMYNYKTTINGTPEEAIRYFKGTSFNLGMVKDNIQECIDCVILGEA